MTIDNRNLTKIIAVTFLLASIIVGSGYIHLQQKYGQLPQSDLDVDYSQRIDDTTGAVKDDMPTSREISASMQFTTLLKLTPSETEAFKLEYDYKKAKFIVTLKEPAGNSRLAFDEWLKELDLPLISQSQFEFR